MMTLREKVLSAIDNPGHWEMIGLLQDVAKELDRIKGMELELADYGKTVEGLRRKLEASERMRLKAYAYTDEGMAEHDADNKLLEGR